METPGVGLSHEKKNTSIYGSWAGTNFLEIDMMIVHVMLEIYVCIYYVYIHI